MHAYAYIANTSNAFSKTEHALRLGQATLSLYATIPSPHPTSGTIHTRNELSVATDTTTAGV